MSVVLPQVKADNLVAIEKKRINNNSHIFPCHGSELKIDIVSMNGFEKFRFVINRRYSEMGACGFLNLYEFLSGKHVPLVRLDVNGKHVNPLDAPTERPDLAPLKGKKFDGPHLHIYVEQECMEMDKCDRWAIEIPPSFTEIGNIFNTHTHFLVYINVSQKPAIQSVLETGGVTE